MFKVGLLINSAYHLKLHVIVSSIDGHTRCGGEDSIEESKVRQTCVVDTRAVHSYIQNIHHVFADQRHHQAGERSHKTVENKSITLIDDKLSKQLELIKIRLGDTIQIQFIKKNYNIIFFFHPQFCGYSSSNGI